MASKTIMIQEETYKKLVRLKKGNESFNDVIERLIKAEQNFEPFFGLLTEKEGEIIEKAIQKAQEENFSADNSRSLDLDD